MPEEEPKNLNSDNNPESTDKGKEWLHESADQGAPTPEDIARRAESEKGDAAAMSEARSALNELSPREEEIRKILEDLPDTGDLEDRERREELWNEFISELNRQNIELSPAELKKILKTIGEESSDRRVIDKIKTLLDWAKERSYEVGTFWGRGVRTFGRGAGGAGRILGRGIWRGGRWSGRSSWEVSKGVARLGTTGGRGFLGMTWRTLKLTTIELARDIGDLMGIGGFLNRVREYYRYIRGKDKEEKK